jgi:hypothetical protein
MKVIALRPQQLATPPCTGRREYCMFMTLLNHGRPEPNCILRATGINLWNLESCFHVFDTSCLTIGREGKGCKARLTDARDTVYFMNVSPSGRIHDLSQGLQLPDRPIAT